MEFKFNKNTRIKIPAKILGTFRNDDGSYINVYRFAEEVGLKHTSRRFVYKIGRVYYFQVIDKTKYFLAKIKYGI